MTTTMRPWRAYKCSRCDLAACRTQVVVATPCRKGGLLAIGEAPGADEDQNGLGFLGKAGKLLREQLTYNEIACTDIAVANICRCRPPNNRKPTTTEIDACLPFLANLIADIRPKVILAVGGRTAVRVLCDMRNTPLGDIIVSKQAENNWRTDVTYAHQGLREVLSQVKYVVPMPHTSPILDGKKAPQPLNRLWSEVVEDQVRLAASLFRART